MRLTKADRKVLDAFGDKRPAQGTQLSTDGQRLDGHWMGGTGIARWHKDGYIVETDTGSRAGQTVQRALRKATPANYYKPKAKKSTARKKPTSAAAKQLSAEKAKIAKLRAQLNGKK